MSKNDKYIYCVMFDKQGNSWQDRNFVYGPYTNKGAATRMLRQEEGRWDQTNGRILCTKVKWEEVE